MFSLFKRKSSPPAELTFKARVQGFWDWFRKESARLYATIEACNCSDLGPEMSTKVDELGPGFAWVFGPGEGNSGHSLTLSGEGVLHKQLLAQYWRERAPTLPGWTFYDARQPGTIDGVCIDIGERRFDPVAFWVTPIINEEEEQFDLVVWHPMFSDLEERDRWTPVFLFLDEVLGEFGTQQWIGEIKLHDQRLAEAIPLKELPALIEQAKAEKGWQKLPPGESTVLFTMKEPHDQFLRGDVITIATMVPNLIREYLDADGELENPLAGTGADYVFFAFDANFLPKGKEATARGAIEDALDAALKSAHSGQLIGGAFGTKFAYIDLLLFDNGPSLKIVTSVLREQKVPSGSAIHFFAKEKRGHRIMI